MSHLSNFIPINKFKSKLSHSNTCCKSHKYNYPALNPPDVAKHKWFIPKKYRLSNEKNNQRGNIQINGDLTRRNSELLTALRVEAKKKDKVHKVWTTLDGKIMYASDPESKNKKIMNSLFQKN